MRNRCTGTLLDQAREHYSLQPKNSRCTNRHRTRRVRPRRGHARGGLARIYQRRRPGNSSAAGMREADSGVKQAVADAGPFLH
jgi:hypothetical protein